MSFKSSERPAVILIIGMLLFFFVQGCGVSKEEYEKVIAQRDGLEQELEDVKITIASLEKEVADLKKANQSLEKSKATLTERVKLYTKLIEENAPDVDLGEIEATLMPPAAPRDLKEYEVKEGESLWIIARDHGVSIESIKEANNLKSNKIKPGQMLYVPVKQE